MPFRALNGFTCITVLYLRHCEQACDAAKSKGMTIEGRQLRVDFSITERAHTPTPGIYLGRTGPWYTHGLPIYTAGVPR